MVPLAIFSNAALLISRIRVLRPLPARTSASGSPTRPAPPTTQTSQLGVRFSFVITTEYGPERPPLEWLRDSMRWKKRARLELNGAKVCRKPRVQFLDVG